MTANLESSGYIDTDALLRERMIPTLGAEAAERFFIALEPMSLTKRTKAIARQAKVLEMLTVKEEEITAFQLEDTNSEPGAAIIDFQEAYTAHAEIEHTHVPNEPVVAEVPVDLDEPAVKKMTAPESTHRSLDMEPTIPLSASKYIDSFTGKGTSALLGLRQFDKEAVVKAILAMNEPLDKRMKPKMYEAIIGGVYDGLSDVGIADMIRKHDDLEVRHDFSNSAIWQRKNKLRSRALELAEQNGTDLEAILRRFVKAGRASKPNAPLPIDKLTDESAQKTSDEHQNAVTLEQLQENDDSTSVGAIVVETSQAEVLPEIAEEKVPDLLMAINDDLAQLTDKTMAASVYSLLNENNFDEEHMLDGRNWLGEMMRQYIPNTEAARQIIGAHEFSKEGYKVLVQLSGANGVSQGERPVTLPMILKYNRLVSEEEALKYTAILLAQAKADQDYELKTEQKYNPPVEIRKPAAYMPKPSVEKLAEPPLPSLWDAAVHNKPMPITDAERAIKQLLEDAVSQEQLKRADAVFLTERLLGDDRRGLLSSEEQATLQKLAQMQRLLEANGYSKLDESLDSKEYFREFTTISKAFGASSVATITDRANHNNKRGNKVQIRQSTVARKIAAAIQVVLEESR